MSPNLQGFKFENKHLKTIQLNLLTDHCLYFKIVANLVHFRSFYCHLNFSTEF